MNSRFTISRQFRRCRCTAFITLALLFGLLGPIHPAWANGIDLPQRSGSAGDAITAVGHDWLTCCPANTAVQRVKLYLRTEEGTIELFEVPADGQGKIRASFIVPRIPPGTYDLEACGNDPQGNWFCLPEGPFTILLPITGAPAWPLALGSALMLVGVFLTRSGQRGSTSILKRSLWSIAVGLVVTACVGPGVTSLPPTAGSSNSTRPGGSSTSIDGAISSTTKPEPDDTAVPVWPYADPVPIGFSRTGYLLKEGCQQAANRLGYPVPCPSAIPGLQGDVPCDSPAGFPPSGEEPGCVVGTGFILEPFLATDPISDTTHFVIEAGPNPRSCIPDYTQKIRGRSVTIGECDLDGGLHFGHTAVYWEANGVQYIVSSHGKADQDLLWITTVVAHLELIDPE